MDIQQGWRVSEFRANNYRTYELFDQSGRWVAAFEREGDANMVAAVLNAPIGREPPSAWWALAMGAAASLEDAANCLRDPDAKRAALGAAEHVRNACKELSTT